MQPSIWYTSQSGAREHYAVPRCLHRRGHLSRLYTDFWCSRARVVMQRGPQVIRAMAGRYHPELPSSRVTAASVRTLARRTWQSATGGGGGEARYFARVVDEGRDFARWVNRHLAKEPRDPGVTGFFGYNATSLESLEFMRDRGGFTVVGQVDPAAVEEQMVLEEVRRWPGWDAHGVGPAPQAYWDRLAAEWRAAALVLVNSEWSRTALLRQGVPAEKLIVVPLAYEPPPCASAAPRRPVADDAPLNVLWLGSVILRKGIPYLVEAAKLLAAEPVQFIVAGPVGISEAAVSSAPSSVRFVGRVTRDQAARWYQQADLFVLPTISDGFAITQLEAMAHGLPVVTTPRCGEVVTQEVDGLIVPAGDADALAAAIRRLCHDRPLLRIMSERAPEKAKQFSLDRYADGLEAACSAKLSGDGAAGRSGGVAATFLR